MSLLVRKNRKKSAKSKRERAVTPVDEKPRRGEASRASPQPRVHEVFGIVTLAAALLLGPSLFSVHAGDGQLMGPFGRALGRALNWSLGLAGYVVVLALGAVALRIFASGLGLAAKDQPRATLWRERVGLGLLTLCAASLLHLAGRPQRVSGASPGGLVGEAAAEALCSVASAPGAWLLTLAGLALALVLATSFSWARTGLAAYRLARALVHHARSLGGRCRRQLGRACAQLALLARRRELGADAGAGAATAWAPPVVRLDLGREPELLSGDDPPRAAAPLPDDLEIGERDGGSESDPPPRPAIAGVDAEHEPRPPAADYEVVYEVEASQVLEELLAADAAPAPPPAPAPAAAAPLTIVEPEFREQPALAGDEAAPDEKRVEPGDGPGFELYNETYRPPPLSLLEHEENQQASIDREAIYRQAERVVKTLADYKIVGHVTEVHPGPVVTMYEFVPAPGTRISKIANLANDLAMSLAAQRVRIVAPIPGKGAVGIEVPNDQRQTVYFKEIVAHDSFRKGKAELALALGKNIVGAPVTMDLARMPHLLVAGATGAGKSVSINAMICSLLLKYTPEEVRLIMVDPKYLELSGYNDIPHLMLPVVTDPKKASIALRWAVAEMERRYQLLADMRVRDIIAYNRKVAKLRSDADELGSSHRGRCCGETELPAEEPASPTPEQPPAPPAATPVAIARPSRVLVVRVNPDGSEEPVAAPELEGESARTPVPQEQASAEPAAIEDAPPSPPPLPPADGKLPRHLPYIVVVIDEFADLMMVASKDVETSVARLAQKARAAGIHVILATQRPSVDVITGLIKANFPSRISFQVASGHDSKTILGSQGAENLLGAGDMLVMDRGLDSKRVHGALIADREIRRIVDWLRGEGRPIYDMEILRPPPDEEGDGEGALEGDAPDEMYDQAVAIVAETRQASISLIQRRLRVGYNRSARMVERMERDGIVGPQDPITKTREVLVQHHGLEPPAR